MGAIFLFTSLPGGHDLLITLTEGGPGGEGGGHTRMTNQEPDGEGLAVLPIRRC